MRALAVGAVFFSFSLALMVLPAAAETIRGVDVGTTVALAKQTRTSNCTLAANPDRRCSPGAYYSKLTKAVICASTFKTSKIRNVPTFTVTSDVPLASQQRFDPGGPVAIPQKLVVPRTTGGLASVMVPPQDGPPM